MQEERTTSMQKSIQLLLGLFVFSAMTASGCTKIAQWIGGAKAELSQMANSQPGNPSEGQIANQMANETIKEMTSYANCIVTAENSQQLSVCKEMKEGFNAETKEQLEKISKLKLQECVSSDLAYIKTFEQIAPHTPNEAKYFVEKACAERMAAEENGEKVPSDPKSPWALVRATKINLGDRAILEEYLRAGPKNLKAKVEKDFFSISKDIKDGKLSCESAKPKIDEFIAKGSIRALLFGSYCIHEKCKDKEGGKACEQSFALAKQAADKGDPIGEVYMGIYEINAGETAKGIDQARHALKLGEPSPIEMIPQLRDEVYTMKVTRPMALVTLATGARYGSSSQPLKACSEAVAFEKWRHAGQEIEADKITEIDWLKYVTQWSDPSSEEYQPKLVLRFDCEILSDPESKKKIYESPPGDHALDFCAEIKDTRFSSVCNKSVDKSA